MGNRALLSHHVMVTCVSGGVPGCQCLQQHQQKLLPKQQLHSAFPSLLCPAAGKHVHQITFPLLLLVDLALIWPCVVDWAQCVNWLTLVGHSNENSGWWMFCGHAAGLTWVECMTDRLWTWWMLCGHAAGLTGAECVNDRLWTWWMFWGHAAGLTGAECVTDRFWTWWMFCVHTAGLVATWHWYLPLCIYITCFLLFSVQSLLMYFSFIWDWKTIQNSRGYQYVLALMGFLFCF